MSTRPQTTGPWTTGPRDHGTTDTLERGFSLVEILVTVALLSFIILGLFAVFNQTQRAFRSTMNQTDILEAGRAVNDQLGRELEQLVPSGGGWFDFQSSRHLAPSLSLYGISGVVTGANFYAQSLRGAPLVQALPGAPTDPLTSRPVYRVNLLQDIFFLLRDNQNWVGIGYCVRTQDVTGRLWLPEVAVRPPTNGVGSLYRYSITAPVVLNTGLPQDPSFLCANFVAACQPGSALISNRVCDGVISFHLRAFATNGFPIFYTNLFGGRASFRSDGFSFPARFSLVQNASAVPTLNPQYPDYSTGCWFWSNAVPASVELELGILEARSLTRFNSIGDPAARIAYLQRDDISTRVQVFRQRIPIRNVDPLAFQ